MNAQIQFNKFGFSNPIMFDCLKIVKSHKVSLSKKASSIWRITVGSVMAFREIGFPIHFLAGEGVFLAENVIVW